MKFLMKSQVEMINIKDMYLKYKYIPPFINSFVNGFILFRLFMDYKEAFDKNKY